MQYVAYLNDSTLQVFTNPQVTSEERPKLEISYPADRPVTVGEGFTDVPQASSAEAALETETAKVKEMTKDAVTIASGKEQSRAQRQEKDSGIGTGSKVKKK
jgi:hypothetical protein